MFQLTAWDNHSTMKTILIIFIALLFGCAAPQQQAQPEQAIHLHKLGKLTVTGDFNGDGKQETLSQHTYSNRYKIELDSAADPFQHTWDTVIHWFEEQEASVFLLSDAGNDTLQLGLAHGLYCLINIGDNNGDGKDEIAVAVDLLDESQLNHCTVYSFCQNKWQPLTRFTIRESAFEFTNNMPPMYEHIPGFLEKQQGKWFFLDALKEDGPMKPLVVAKCEPAQRSN